jgi:hypothetical protein
MKIVRKEEISAALPMGQMRSEAGDALTVVFLLDGADIH